MKIVLKYRNTFGSFGGIDDFEIESRIRGSLAHITHIIRIGSINVSDDGSKQSKYGINNRYGFSSKFEKNTKPTFSDEISSPFSNPNDCWPNSERKRHDPFSSFGHSKFKGGVSPYNTGSSAFGNKPSFFEPTGFNTKKDIKVEVHFNLQPQFGKKRSNKDVKRIIEEAVSLDGCLELVKITGLEIKSSSLDGCLELVKISGLKIESSPFYGQQPYCSIDTGDPGFEKYAKQFKKKAREKKAEEHRQGGNKCFKKEQFKGALTYYAHAQVLDPNNPIISFNIGMTFKQQSEDESIAGFLRQGKIKDAIDYFRQAIRLDPDYLKPSWNLVDIFVKQKDQEGLTYLLDFLKDKSSPALSKLTEMIAEKWPEFSLDKYQQKETSTIILKSGK